MAPSEDIDMLLHEDWFWDVMKGKWSAGEEFLRKEGAKISKQVSCVLIHDKYN